MPINFTQQQRQALLAVLGNGRPNAIGGKRLAQILCYPTSGNQVKLRTLIKECIENDNDLIGATTGRPVGFFIISNTFELETYLDSLEKRTRSDNNRRTALINSWNIQTNISNTAKQTLSIQ